jgi:16S rRNA G966 N2-methylase RsmD
MPILHWLDRAKHTKIAEAVPYRLLEAEDAHSSGDPEASNMLIQGDNLEALKSLLPYYAGRVKCIFIDPPYNTRSAFFIPLDQTRALLAQCQFAHYSVLPRIWCRLKHPKAGSLLVSVR